MSIAFFVMSLWALREIGVEAEMKLSIEDVEMVHINSKYFDPKKTELYVIENEETGVNTIGSTLALIKQPPADTEARLTITGLSMGQYTIPTGIDMKSKLCEMYDEPIIMAPVMIGLGFSQDACPPPPGVYHQDGFKFPVENLPDEFPENMYLINLIFTSKENVISDLKIYILLQIL